MLNLPSIVADDVEYQRLKRADQVDQLAAEVERLQSAIRKHRDYRGDDRCHLDDGELYAVLPEGDTRPPRDTAVTLENCKRFIECRQQGREYVSPELEIKQLRALCLEVFQQFGGRDTSASDRVLLSKLRAACWE